MQHTYCCEHIRTAYTYRVPFCYTHIKRMVVPSIHRMFTVDVKPDEAWERIADVGGINHLLDFLGEVTIDGDRRICSLGDMGVLDERILAIDHEHRRVAYTIVDAPMPFTHHSAAMSVDTDDDGRTRIWWITDFSPAELHPQVEGLIDQGVVSMTGTLTR